MAWGVFTISKDGRQRLAVVLRALLIAQLVVSLCTVIFCYNTSLKVMLLLKHIHKVTVFLLYGLVLLQAYATKLLYTSGLRLISWLVHCPHWPRASSVCKIWLATGTLVSFNGLLVYAAARGTLKALMKELSSSLRCGISQYLTEPMWKNLLDTMQVDLSCCGAEAPSDWHEIPWINVDFLNENTVLVMKLATTDGKVMPAVTPYSCCTPRVLAACYHDPLQQTEWRSVWAAGAALPAATLHTRGCVEAVRAPLSKALLVLQAFNVLVCVLQLFIVVLTQLLRTSVRDAVLTGDCENSGRAALCGAPAPRRHSSLRTVSERAKSDGNTSACAFLSPKRKRRNRRDVRSFSSYPYLSLWSGALKDR